MTLCRADGGGSVRRRLARQGVGYRGANVADRELSPDEVRDILEAATPKRSDEWYWEGNVQDRVVAFLRESEWTITREANTATKEHGVDVLAEKDGRTLAVEVIGYPLAVYAAGPKAGQAKPTRPTTQARQWFNRVLMTVIGRRIRYGEETELAIAMPAMPTYDRLLVKGEWALERLEIGVYWVEEGGAVTARLPHRR